MVDSLKPVEMMERESWLKVLHCGVDESATVIMKLTWRDEQIDLICKYIIAWSRSTLVCILHE